MAFWMNLGQQFRINASKFPGSIALKDKSRTFTYFETNDRVNCLTSGFYELGLKKGDKIAVLMENCIELVELYLATAKTGLIIVPINFRLLADEVAYIVDNSDAKLLCFSGDFLDCVNEAKQNMSSVLHYIIVGDNSEKYLFYDFILQKSKNDEPEVEMNPEDTWIIIYTSGTTGSPKGVVRSHESHVAFYLINAIDFGFTRSDKCMNVMPLCHINSVFFTFIFLYIGAVVYIHPARSFNPSEILSIFEEEQITFVSLIPTHYRLIVDLYESSSNYDVSSIKKLLCSSAAVRKSIKLAIMDFFPGVELYEGYGSSEAGIVTVLKPEDQIRKLGSVGYESLGTDIIRIIGEDGKDVSVGQIGEIYSRGPMLFKRYYKMPEATCDSFIDGWFSAGDMGYKDDDGFYQIVDRKDNMIITGGEHVYPSEVEEVISEHPFVSDVAVLGVNDDKWGEKVIAVVVSVDGSEAKFEIIGWCKARLAAYKCPKDILFIKQEEMPRTATGKILHRMLRKRFGDIDLK